MLHYATINAPTLELLKQLLEIQEFSGLRLAGGTALALQIGHRKSIDLDLFGNMDVDEFFITKKLSSLGSISLIRKTQNIFIYLINNLKVELVNYPYPWLEDQIIVDGLRLAGKNDIAAMKLAAITGRGSRKDFIDIFYLLKQYNLATMLEFYKEKFFDGSPFLVLKSLTYFDDADYDQDPFMLEPLVWKEVKKSIINSVDEYIKDLN